MSPGPLKFWNSEASSRRLLRRSSKIESEQAPASPAVAQLLGEGIVPWGGKAVGVRSNGEGGVLHYTE